MGWKTYFELTESDFKSMYEDGKLWGGWVPLRFKIGEKVHYAVGLSTSYVPAAALSPLVDHYVGYRTRITLEIYAISDGIYNWYGGVLIGFKTDGDWAKDTAEGVEFHGARIDFPKSPTGEPLATYYTVVFEQANNVVTIYRNGQEIGKVQFAGNLVRFALLLEVRAYMVASEQQATGDGVVIAVTHIKAEYYDWIEDLIANFIKIMNIMMWVMIGVMFVVMLIRAFRTEKGGE